MEQPKKATIDDVRDMTVNDLIANPILGEVLVIAMSLDDHLSACPANRLVQAEAALEVAMNAFAQASLLICEEDREDFNRRIQQIADNFTVQTASRVRKLEQKKAGPQATAQVVS